MRNATEKGHQQKRGYERSDVCRKHDVDGEIRPSGYGGCACGRVHQRRILVSSVIASLGEPPKSEVSGKKM